MTKCNKGNVISEMIKSLKKENELISFKNEQLHNEFNEIYEKFQRSQFDMNVYARALELKAEEFQRVSTAMGVDIKASLL